jgi:uncharacterized protein (DUF433 family)/DNA-binding transcriptional MerR regulator
MAETPTAIGSYTAAEVARLAGVSSRRIGRWASEGIILPSVSRHPNIYSYADAGEALLAHYLIEQRKPPSQIKGIVHHLRETYGPWPLATAPLAHDGKLVVLWDSKRKRWVSADIPEHEVLNATLLNLKDIRESLGRGGWVAFKKPRKHIEVDPERHSGTPVVRGRRLPTSLVAAVASGKDGRKILREDYGLKKAEIDDAVGYEADVAELVAA